MWLIIHQRVSHCSNPRHNTKGTVVEPTVPLFPTAPYHALFPHISFNRQHRSAGSALQICIPIQLSRMFFDIGVQICGFEGLSKQDNGLNSTCNKMYALVVQKAVHWTQHRQISQIPFELYPGLAPHKPSLRWLRGWELEKDGGSEDNQHFGGWKGGKRLPSDVGHPFFSLLAWVTGQ